MQKECEVTDTHSKRCNFNECRGKNLSRWHGSIISIKPCVGKAGEPAKGKPRQRQQEGSSAALPRRLLAYWAPGSLYMVPCLGGSLRPASWPCGVRDFAKLAGPCRRLQQLLCVCVEAGPQPWVGTGFCSGPCYKEPQFKELPLNTVQTCEKQGCIGNVAATIKSYASVKLREQTSTITVNRSI